MSLTREEWEQVWDDINKISKLLYTKKGNEISLRDKAIKRIKDKIQQVIGQKE